MVFPVVGAHVFAFDWTAPDRHGCVMLPPPADAYFGPVVDVCSAVRTRFPDPSRATCDGRYYCTSDCARYPHRVYTHHSGSIAPPAVPLKSSPNTRPENGVFAPDAVDSAPVPDEFDAFTVNVYAVLLVSPDTVICRYVDPLLPTRLPVDAAARVVGDCGDPAMYGVTVYDVTELDPDDAGARNDTVADASAAIDVTAVGAPGGVPNCGRAVSLPVFHRSCARAT
jgi:hypothetical protein